MRFWGRRTMVSGQVALSLVLLVLTAVLVRGFSAGLERGPGFRVDGLQLMTVDTGLVHDSDAQRNRFFHDLEQSARTLPGIRNAALAQNVPLGVLNTTIQVTPEGLQVKKGEPAPAITNNVVTPAFFDVFGLPILKGRGFSEHDTASSAGVAVVNEQFAAHYWPNQDPIGKRVRMADAPGKELQVIGVAKTAKYFWITEPPTDFIYLPLAQNPNSGMTLVAQSAGPDPTSLFPELRDLVHRLDPNMPISQVRTMRSLFNDRAVTTPRYIVKIVGAMGLLALILSCVGLYGLVSYAASRRVREFGIRVALGAQRGQVARLVLNECIWMAVAGGAVGLVAGALASNGMQSQIFFKFQPIGWAPYAVVCLILLATVCLAGYGPAHRASRTDPVRALREE